MGLRAVRFTANIALTWERKGINLPSEWIAKRKQEWSTAKAEFERRRDLDRKASSVSDSLFDRLKEQVRQDVADYNKEFKEDCCKCKWELINDGFRVDRESGNPPNSLIVLKTVAETIIKFFLRASLDQEPKPEQAKDYLELKPDYDTGEIHFYHRGERIVDLEAASAFLLSAVICSPSDYAV